MHPSLFRTRLALPFLLGALSACSLFEKKDETPKPGPGPEINADTLVLKPGKGFTQLVIIPSSFSGSAGANGGFNDGISLFDMSLKPDGSELYLGVTSQLSTQQDPLVSFARLTLNMNDRSLRAQPLDPSTDINLIRSTYTEFAYPVGNRTRGFQRGTNNIFFGSRECDNFGICTARILGDFGYSRTYTFASTPRVSDDGIRIESGRIDNHASWAPTWRQRIFGAMAGPDGFNWWMQSITTVANRESAIFPVAFEPKGQGTGSVWFCGASSKKIYVGEVEFSPSNVETPIRYTDSLDLPTGFSTSYQMSLQTRMAADKSKMAILLSNGETSNKVCSFVFGTGTKKLSRNIDNLSIPDLNSQKIDTDIDEDGNLYFDGWANNFQSDSTISLYKASGQSIVSIGEDILRSGSIKGVRWMNGKVYAGVVYALRATKAPGFVPNNRVAILKQD